MKITSHLPRPASAIHHWARYCCIAVLVVASPLLGGCYANDSAVEVDLGSVSIGQQLIDLKKARDSGAMTGSEYRAAKANILQLAERLEQLTETDDDDVDNDDDEEDNGFLF